MSTDLLSIVLLVLSSGRVLDLIRLFQIKEYRSDRFNASIQDNGYVQTFLTWPRLPAKSPRNLIIVLVSLLLLITLTWYLRFHAFVMIGAIILHIPLSLLLVLVGVKVSGVFSYIKRRLIIAKAAAHLSGSDAVTIGITGSFGKTTTKEFLWEILRRKFVVAKTDENMNTDVGVALSILKNVKNDTQYFIAEMGAYKKGEIRDICMFTRPHYGIITGIGNQHLRLFGSKNNLIQAKKELLDSLPESGKAYVNVEGKERDLLVAGIKPEVFFFTNDTSETTLPSCIALARDLGMKEDEITKAIDIIRQKTNRLTPQPGTGGSLVIDNSYNTSRESFIRTIHILSHIPRQNKIMVCRGVIELGSEKTATYAKLGLELEENGVTLFTTDRQFSNPANSKIKLFKSEQELDQRLARYSDEKTVIAFEGRYNKETINRFKSI